MATRCKTVEFAIPTEQATLAGGSGRLFSVDVFLPESSKVFRSVTLEVGFTDDVTAGGSATSVALEFTLIPAAADLTTVTDEITSSGEATVYHVSRDLTDYFNENWDGAEMSGRLTLTVGVVTTNNHWGKLRITYEYDDTSTTHIKTIWYPIESTRALLTTSYQTIGGALAIPAIKGGASILPEHNVTVRQVWVELIGNQGTASATDFSLDLKLTTDATEQTTLYRVEASLATPGWLHAIWDVTDSDLDEQQPLEAKVTGVTNRVAQICGWVGITYEYDPVGTALVWNSLMLPAFDEEEQRGATTSARKTLHVRELWIEEPATISLRPSGVFAFYSDNSVGSSLSVWVNEQSPRSFSTLATGAPMVVGQRMDGGGASGAGLDLVRGRNQIKVHQFSDNADPGAVSAVNGFMLLNYTSGVSPAGIGAHNQTRHFALGWFQADATRLEFSSDTTAPKTPTIPELGYFLNAVSMQAAWLSSPASQQALRIQAQRTGVEGLSGDGSGWASVYHGAVASAAENWLRWTTADCSSLFRRWSGDPVTARMDVEAPRRWQALDAAGIWVGVVGLQVTYHSIARSVHGTLSGTGGDGSGLAVVISRQASGEKVLDVTTGTGGRYDVPWYDDTEALCADVFEDDSHVGRSAPFFAEGLYVPPPGPDPDPALLIKLDAFSEPDDTTTLDATDARHGLLPKLSGLATDVLSGIGTWVEGRPIDVQVFDTVGADTWVKPTGFTPTMVMLIVIGAGGGGGGGGDNSTTNARMGGCGGGAGAHSRVLLPASLLADEVALMVGAGGAGGPGGTTNGTSGSVGGDSYVGDAEPYYAYAAGGGGGRLGTSSLLDGQGGGGGGNGDAGGVGSTTDSVNEGYPGIATLRDTIYYTSSGGTGGRGGFQRPGGSAEFGGGGGGGRDTTPTAFEGGSSMFGGGGGGCGGHVASGGTAIQPAAGGMCGRLTAGGGGAAGSSGTTPTVGSAGAAGDGIRLAGKGGGGGGSKITSDGNGAAGGAGGASGGGGGGGGAGRNATGGAGAQGGRGNIVVITW